ncbi:MAG: M14 family zinc carboxypeptidase, partial [Gemmatimonadaceae bacterium]
MRSLGILAFFAIAAIAGAQPQPSSSGRDTIRDDRSFSFYDRGPFRPQVPRPDSLLGYGVGDLHTQFAWQERVLLAIAGAARDRVRVEEIGLTTERRVQRLFIVSSPENIARLDAIRADLDRLADPRSLSAAEAEALIARVPAVVWVNESVHGDEAPGFETAMQTLYQLAASTEPATVAALTNVVVVLNPSTNPDGHERFSAWYNSISVRSPETFALEYQQPWSISGRFNHYRFDMNRDVMTTTQRESRALLMGAMRWHPMVTIDQHGYTYSFFFPPTARPMNANLGGDFQKWMEIFGRANATAFDRFGWMYYSRDVFDFYGPFYWDSWPSLTGAIGMTYETDCRYGIRTRREDGSMCSFRAAIAKHFVSAMATIEATAARRAELEETFARFPGFLRELRSTMVELRSFSDQATPVFSDLGQAAPSLTRAARALEPFSNAGVRAFTSLGDAAEEAGPPLRASDPVIRQARNLAEASAPATRELGRVLTTMRKTGGFRGLMETIFGLGGTVNAFDQFGHLARALIPVNVCFDYTSREQSGCSARFDTSTSASALRAFARMMREPIDTGRGGGARGGSARAGADALFEALGDAADSGAEPAPDEAAPPAEESPPEAEAQPEVAPADPSARTRSMRD